MSLDSVTQRWIKILSLIKVGNTGSQSELAHKLGVSEATLKRDIQLLNKLIATQLFTGLDSPIIYQKKEKAYIIDRIKKY